MKTLRCRRCNQRLPLKEFIPKDRVKKQSEYVACKKCMSNYKKPYLPKIKLKGNLYAHQTCSFLFDHRTNDNLRLPKRFSKW